MRILVAPSCARRIKRLHPNQKKSLDKAITAISSAPDLGEEKMGDLVGVYIYKFKLGNERWLLAYRVVSSKEIKLLLVGPHENFYRELKKV
jgi:mRNA-degrading endonuclease RelE of RelBE toxin-antitoxin system